MADNFFEIKNSKTLKEKTNLFLGKTETKLPRTENGNALIVSKVSLIWLVTIYSVTNFSLNHLLDKIGEGHSTISFYFT